MPDTSQTTPSAHPPTNDDPEGLPPVPKKTRLLASTFSRLSNAARRHPFLSATLIHACLSGVIAGTSMGFYGWEARPAFEQIPDGRSGIALIGHTHRVDMTGQTLSIEWEIVGCGSYRLPTYPPSGSIIAAAGCDNLDRAADIYLNGASKPTFSYDPANFPLSQTYGILYVNALNVFNVDHSIDYRIAGMVPFDVYYLYALVFVIEKATNKSIPIIAFAAGETPDNFVISSIQLQAKSNYTYDPGTGPTTVEVDSNLITITAKRSQLAQAFTVCLLSVNSVLAISSTCVTLLVLFSREGVDNAVLLLPVTIVLTIPALRSLYVGSPPFGIYIDTFGFFLQMMTVAVCSMILLFKVTMPSAQGGRASHDSGKGYITRILDRILLKRSGSAT